MISRERNCLVLVKEVRKQLALSQKNLARELGVSWATVNGWENRQSRLSRMAKVLLGSFWEKMVKRGRLALLIELKHPANGR
jgi:putative transcriptional regulator